MLGIEEQEVNTHIGQDGRHLGLWGAGRPDNGLPGFQEIFDSVHVTKTNTFQTMNAR